MQTVWYHHFFRMKDQAIRFQWMFVNPLGKGGYEIHSLESHAVFVKVADLKQGILSSCEQFIEMDKELQFGYVVPGHGKKSKQLAVLSDEDLQEMYKKHKKKREILLWMKQSRKRPRVEQSLHI